MMGPQAEVVFWLIQFDNDWFAACLKRFNEPYGIFQWKEVVGVIDT